MLELLQYRTWCIAEDFYNSVAPTLSQWLASGHSVDRFIAKKTMAEHVEIISGLLAVSDIDVPQADLHMSVGYDSATRLPVITSGNSRIAVIPMVGVMTKYGGACAYGSQDYQAMIARAVASDKIDAILLKADSPGGAVDGTQELASTVRDSPKPIGTFVDGLNASAMYWVTSQSKFIIANKLNSNTIGSIGTYGVYQNISGKLEKEGIVTKIIRAKQSTKKIAVNPVEPLTPEGESEMVNHATAINSIFISYVEKARPNADKSVFEAGTYNNSTAKEAGLIDGVGTMQTAVNKLIDVIREQKKQGTSGASPNANTEMNYPKLIALLGAAWTSLFHSGSEAKTSLSPEQIASLEASETKLTELEAQIAQLLTGKETADATIAQLNATVSEQLAQISALEGEKTTLTEENATQKAALAEKPTGTATTVIPGKGEAGQAADQGATTQKSKFRTSQDDESDKYVNASQPHNFSK